MDEVLNSNQSLFIMWCRYLGIKFSIKNIYKYGVSKKDWDRLDSKMKLCKKIGYPPIFSEDQPLDMQAVYVFNKIIEKTGAKVLMCSSWRLGRSIQEINSLLASRGVKCDVIGKTPKIWKTFPKQKIGDIWTDPPICKYPFYSGHERGEEILWWLKEHAPNVKNVLIIDDSCKKDIIQLFPNNCIIPNSNGGLKWKYYQQCLNILEQPINVVEIYDNLKNNNPNLNEQDF